MIVETPTEQLFLTYIQANPINRKILQLAHSLEFLTGG